ncbi:MAG: Uma2 family endonuclease [Actinobacteria bacterium]|nr:Uma2 family endonuclease [Actinomycetota bacterium]
MAVAQRMTADEFIAAPEPQRGRPWNLVDGEVVVNDPTMVHGDSQNAIHSALLAWSRAEAGRGKIPWPCDVQLDERNVYVPDVLWYRDGRVPDPQSPPPYPIPDLAVEVRSPSTWRYDTGRKKAVYESAGLPELWLVDTSSLSILVFRRSNPGAPGFDAAFELGCSDRLTSPLLPGFELDVGDVFSSVRDQLA